MFEQEKSVNPQNPEDRKKVKIEDEMTNWKRNPVWLQTIFVMLIFLGFAVMNWTTLSTGIVKVVNNFVNLRLVDLFALSFIVNLVLMAWFILAIIWTGNITNKLIYAKLFRKRTLWVLTDDKVLELFLPDTKERGFWRVKNFGRWKTLDRAMFWMKNGSLSMLAIEDHIEGICLKDIKDKVILKGDPKHFEKRIDVAYMEGIEQSDNPLKNVDPMQVFIILVGLGIAVYLIMTVLQGNECQANLIKMAQTCGEKAQPILNATAKASGNAVTKGLNTLMP